MAKKIIIWLSYLDPSLTRRLGRRVPRNLLPSKVTFEDILRACEELGLECEVLEDKVYPRTWYLGHKGVSITYNGSKSELLRKLAAALSKKLSTP
ncbi:MAG: signal recognition particle subunit SRP19/SEC65 family protein [Desulfurococcales archaeon]|jgi:signal recognition particle subunit SRP19|nr:signal recognition particle subunit SRP19/SEC65 family protein [Desulfurococcales archaeon]